MKKIIALVVILFSIGTLVNAQVAADFKFDKETHDFGNILMTKPATVEFKFTNVGDVPLIISNVTAPCGCTVPQWTKTPVKKGETGIITVTYTPNPTQALPFTKQVTILSNAKLNPKVLYIKGITVASLPTAAKD